MKLIARHSVLERAQAKKFICQNSKQRKQIEKTSTALYARASENSIADDFHPL